METTENEYEVFYVVSSPSMKSSELASLIGSVPDFSTDKGVGRATLSLWRLDGEKKNTFHEAFASLKSKVEHKNLNIEKLKKYPDITMDVRIAVYFNTADCVVDISNEYVKWAGELGANVLVNCYPFD